MTELLKIQGLGKSFRGKKTPAVADLSLEIRTGEILGLVGLNGAGKTSTIRMAAGITLPTAGSVTVAGHDIVHDKAEASRHLGWVPEFPNFEPNAQALRQLRYYAGFHGLTGRSAARRSNELLDLVGLEEAKRRPLRTFSQGMKKRFSLAASLISDPEVFLFDEILNGLDPQGVLQVRNLMLDLKKRDRAILLSSHILAEVEHVADRVAIVHQGRVLRTLTRDEMLSSSGSHLRITVTNLDDAGLEYLRTLGEVRQEGITYRISDPNGDPGDINAELVHRGFHVTQIGKESKSLEDLFFEIIGRSGGVAE